MRETICNQKQTTKIKCTHLVQQNILCTSYLSKRLKTYEGELIYIGHKIHKIFLRHDCLDLLFYYCTEALDCINTMYIKGLQNLMTAVQMGGPDLKMEVKNIHWAKLFANRPKKTFTQCFHNGQTSVSASTPWHIWIGGPDL